MSLGRFDMLPKVKKSKADMSKWVVAKWLAMRLIGVGFFIGVCIALGVVAGLWLDSKFHTEPLLVIVGLLAGITVAFYGVYRMLLPFMSKKENS